MSDPATGTQAMLASLSFGLPPQGKQLKREAEQIEENAHAMEGVTKAACFFFRQKQGKETIDALANLKSHFNFWKKEHTRLTLPWVGSTRFLAAAIVPAYLDMRSRMEQEAPVKAAEFYEVHADWEVTAPHRLGALYKASEFPSLETCRECIRWENTLMPVPDGEQWRRVALIDPGLMEREEARHNQAVERAREEGRLGYWRDLLAHFERMTEVLSRDKVRIHETLIGGLTSLLDMMPAYGPLFNDENLVRCANEARQTLASITTDDLRQDPALRRQVADSARGLASRFGEFGQRRFA